ncbi:hypothetical protein [Tenacibaculum sp. IB213877]|uniref:hypothetical protein n=1 Tax=Tenacibaculum sp. IB213877 TaxID=3097351 RepID=UPI002A5AE0FE|nr:hypothetical protein [Tenacibaculum sp. IB213877]MDY0780635.1 hypothetical protein [Tenacibaculum sp. IB213877]
MYKKIIIITFFIFFWLVDLWMIYIDERAFLIFPRVLSLSCLIIFYFFSVKKINVNFYILSFFILVTGALFSLNEYTLLGMLSLIALRISWISLLLSYKEKNDHKFIGLIFTLSITIMGVVMYSMYVNTSFFFLSILTSITLLFLLAISFSKLVSNGSQFGNKEMFISIMIFVFSDALSGAKKIDGTNTLFIMLSVFLYNIAYYFLIQALIKKDNKLLL